MKEEVMQYYRVKCALLLVRIRRELVEKRIDCSLGICSNILSALLDG